MKKIICLLLTSLTILYLSCSKSEDLIDVSTIYVTDNNGVPVNKTNDNQWKLQNFASNEMALFTDLDTVDLSKTEMPISVEQFPAYPNPFSYFATIRATPKAPYSGSVIIKYVIVNSKLQPMVKKSQRSTTSFDFLVGNDIGSGKYRIYFTLSSLGNPHFYKSWGNIQKN
jgi:hypothetical protein